MRFGIPKAWIERVISAESAGAVTLAGRPITSRAGAMGLMQLMPATWDDMRRHYGFGPNPYDPRDNILAGTAYLRLMYDRFGYPGLFAAYNAGPARYADHVARGTPLPRETRVYLIAVTGTIRSADSLAARTLLFALETMSDRSADYRTAHVPSGALFVVLSPR